MALVTRLQLTEILTGQIILLGELPWHQLLRRIIFVALHPRPQPTAILTGYNILELTYPGSADRTNNIPCPAYVESAAQRNNICGPIGQVLADGYPDGLSIIF